MEDGKGSMTPPLPLPKSPTAHPSQQSSQSPSESAEMEHQQEEQWLEAENANNEGKDERMDGTAYQSRLPRPANSGTPEPRVITLPNPHASSKHRPQVNGHGHAVGPTPAARLAPERSATPDTPGTVRSIPSFEWGDLEVRFETALMDANQHEQALMAEFQALVRFFNVWASSASAHDNERATKRLQTRTQFVQLKEADFEKKKEYYKQVMQAFQSAMNLLSQS